MASSNVSDVIVIGAGVEGSAAAYNIASRGKKVVLLEQVHSCTSFISRSIERLRVCTFVKRCNLSCSLMPCTLAVVRMDHQGLREELMTRTFMCT